MGLQIDQMITWAYETKNKTFVDIRLRTGPELPGLCRLLVNFSDTLTIRWCVKSMLPSEEYV